MKKQKIKYAVLYCILALIWGILIASLFMGCNVYEHEEVEIIRCPQIQDTVQLPDWESSQGANRELGFALGTDKIVVSLDSLLGGGDGRGPAGDL